MALLAPNTNLPFMNRLMGLRTPELQRVAVLQPAGPTRRPPCKWEGVEHEAGGSQVPPTGPWLPHHPHIHFLVSRKPGGH